MYIRALLILCLSTLFLSGVTVTAHAVQSSWWKIQSIDTMKSSRDLSQQVVADPKKFTPIIDMQMRDISDVGATHVSIGTPYDEEFVPALRLWVQSARKNGLKVWFRGNFSGWEGWFSYKKITRTEHLEMTKEFIRKHPELFENGDIFSPCPECENGGPGDPRIVGGVEEYRQFLLDLYKISRDAFHSIGKNVDTNMHSMNGDVARLVMDEETTRELGGIVTVDHYVGTPDQLAEDIAEYARLSGGKIVLGEYGVPIPDIHGNMSEAEQAKWIDQSLSKLSLIPELIGINYWVNVGGSTALWDDGGSPRSAVSVLKSYFTPRSVNGTVRDIRDRPIAGVRVKSDIKSVLTDENGQFQLPYFGEGVWLQFSREGYKQYSVEAVSSENSSLQITLEQDVIGFWQWVLIRLHRMFPMIF